MGSWVVEKRHALALDGLHESRLCDALAHQRDDVPVQVGQVTREAEKGLSKRGWVGGWVGETGRMSKKKPENMI